MSWADGIVCGYCISQKTSWYLINFFFLNYELFQKKSYASIIEQNPQFILANDVQVLKFMMIINFGFLGIKTFKLSKVLDLSSAILSYLLELLLG